MELTRRDALVALGGIGGGAAAVGTARKGSFDGLDQEEVTDRLHAVAEAIYPSDLEIDRSFVSTYVIGRLDGRDGYVREQADALSGLDVHARRRTGRAVTALAPSDRRSVLRSMGVHTAHPNPDGTLQERVRYFVVNDLLYVLFSTPTGSELVGVENPPGHPGGREAYQRGPDE